MLQIMYVSVKIKESHKQSQDINKKNLTCWKLILLKDIDLKRKISYLEIYHHLCHQMKGWICGSKINRHLFLF